MPARLISALAILLLSTTAIAEEKRGWTSETGLNGSRTTGNTNTTDLGLSLKIKNRGSDWRHTLRATADYGRNSGKTNKSRFRTNYKIGRDLGPRVYSFVNADYYSDDFGAYKLGYYGGGGVGYSALVDKPTLWRIESGLGYRSQKARLAPNDPSGLSSRKEGSITARLYSDFEHHINDKVSFTNDTELFYSELDTYITNETAMTSDLWESLAFRASFRIETHTIVPEGREKTDTISRIGIVYKME